jgi:hypothetical protein
VSDLSPARFRDYKSCMFSRVEACYNHAWITDGPEYRRVDWSQHLGYLSRMRAVARQRPNAGDCDPRCGISLGGALLLALPVALGLAGLGAVLRGLRRDSD